MSYQQNTKCITPPWHVRWLLLMESEFWDTSSRCPIVQCLRGSKTLSFIRSHSAMQSLYIPHAPVKFMDSNLWNTRCIVQSVSTYKYPLTYYSCESVLYFIRSSTAMRCLYIPHAPVTFMDNKLWNSRFIVQSVST